MAIEYMDGFDHYSTPADVGWVGAGATITTSNPRNGSRCLNIAASNTGVLTLTAQATRIVGAGIRPTTGLPGSVQVIWDFLDAGTEQIGCYILADGTITVRRGGGGGTTLSTSSLTLAAGQYYFVEFKATISDASGSYEVRVNGVTYTSGSSVDTKNTSNATANQVRIGPVGSGGANYDDMYICNSSSPNNDFLGDLKVTTLYADGAGNSSQWTPSAGSNYQNVDEAQVDGDTTYNSDSTAGHIDLYTFGALSGSPAVKGVALAMTARKDDAGTRTIAAMVRISSTNYQGATTHSLLDGYSQFRENYDVSPATSSAWTASEIAGAEFGAKLVA